jgi:peptidoglycan-associated lipoprotein
MRSFNGAGWLNRVMLGAGVLVVASACARVTPDELAEELAQIRAEMRDGDEQVQTALDSRIDGVEGRLNSLEQDLSALQEEFNVTVDRLEAALRFNTPVHFTFDDATVQSEHHEVLDRFAQVVRGHYADAVVTVEGFADPAGPAEYNQRLGLERAESVLEYLLGAGLPETQLRAVSYGSSEDRQIVPGERGPGDEGWQNRRVSFVIDFDGAGTPPVTDEDGWEGA